MTEVSCLYIHFNRSPKKFTFIKYDNNFYKTIINNKSIIINNITLLNIPFLLDYYLLSLLCTKNTTSGIIKIDNKYHISVKWYWKRLYFLNYYKNVELPKNSYRNPLNSKNPNRESSNKKINKFLKYYNTQLLCTIDIMERSLYLYLTPELYIIESEIIILKEKIKINKYINILTSIKKYYGKDIYDNIRIYL